MRRILPILGLVLACPLAWAAGAQLPVSPAGVAVSDHAPAVVAGPRPAAVWLASARAGRRVQLASPLAAPATQIGPRSAGNDGPPSLAADEEGGLMVLAVREGTPGRIWSLYISPDGEQRLRWLRSGPGTPSFPTVALGADGGWAVWVESGPAGDRLVASAWHDGSWGAAEELPPRGGRPGVPAIAVDARGMPVVVWSEADGADAEIFMSRRRATGWTPPRTLSRNRVPDVLPSIAADGDDLVVAWSQLSSGDRYVAVAAFGRGGTWSAPRQLGSSAASGVRVAAAAPPTIVWSEAAPDSRERLITGVEAVDGRLRPLGVLGRATSARHDAQRRGSALALAWHQQSDIAIASARREDGWRTTVWRGSAGLAGAAAMEIEPRRAVLPDSYLGFGDSITLGIASSGVAIVYLDPYTSYLQGWIDAYLNEVSAIANAGVGGEFTIEGLVRIQGELQGQRVALILEGANDMYNRLDPATVATNLQFMTQSAIAAGSVPVMSTVMPFANLGFQDGRNLAIMELNEILRGYALDNEILLVDMYAAFFAKQHLYSDEIHPNEAGYEEMARVWFRGIKPLLDLWLQSEDIERDVQLDKQLDRKRPPVRGRE